MMCVCEASLLFLKIPYQGTTPLILKLKFPVHTSGPKQKRKLNKLKIIKFRYKLPACMHQGLLLNHFELKYL